MPAAEEAAVRRQRRGVRRLEHEVPRLVDELRLLLRVAAPQHEHDRLFLGIHLADDPVGEALPPALAVRRGLAHFDRQHAVEQEHALLRPMFEKAVALRPDAEVALQLLVDVDEARRRADPRLDREAQTMRLPLAVIGVLPEDHHAHLVERGEVKRPEPVGPLGENPLSPLALGGKEALEVAHIGFIELASMRSSQLGCSLMSRVAMTAPCRLS